MSRRRRAALLLGLALVLGALAASDVARRESALRAELAPLVEVVVARGPLEAGRRLRAGDLARRAVPERFAPVGAAGVGPRLLVGRRLAVPVAEGGPVGPLLLEPRCRRRAPASAAASARPRWSRPRRRARSSRARGWTCWSRATVGRARAARSSRSRTSRCSPPARRPSGDGERRGGRSVAATLRVSVRQAVYLAAAGSFAREIRLLVRAPGDRRRVGAVSAAG